MPLALEKDYRDLLIELNRQGAKYLIVGGYAVSVYTEPRATKDIDPWVKTDAANSVAIYRALASYGAPLAGVTPEDFHSLAQTGYQIGVVPNRVDLLHEIDGVSFDEAWENRVETMMDGDVLTYVISMEDLVKNKLHSGRKRDLLDVEAIRDAVAKTKPSR